MKIIWILIPLVLISFGLSESFSDENITNHTRINSTNMTNVIILENKSNSSVSSTTDISKTESQIEITKLTEPTNLHCIPACKQENTLQYISMFVSAIGGVGIPIGGLIYSTFRSRRKLISRNSNSLTNEISTTEDTLLGKVGYQTVNYRGEYDNRYAEIRYTNAFLDTDSYDSLISSGQFSYFKETTQTSLRELYSRVKDHNKTIEYTNNLEDQFFMEKNEIDEKFYDVITRYDISLTRLEIEILKLIPKTKKELQSENKWVL